MRALAKKIGASVTALAFWYGGKDLQPWFVSAVASDLSPAQLSLTPRLLAVPSTPS